MDGAVAGEPATQLEAAYARIRDLEAALGQNDENMAVALKLTPALNNLLGLLLALPNVTSEMIHQRLEIATDAKVAVHRLRVHLRAYGFEIKSRRNLGYWLESDTKKAIRALIDDDLDAPVESQPVTLAA